MSENDRARKNGRAVGDAAGSGEKYIYSNTRATEYSFCTHKVYINS